MSGNASDFYPYFSVGSVVGGIGTKASLSALA